MEIRNFVTFVTIVETGSFIKTAKRLNYAQSSITSHIKAIEDYFGQSVFDRLGKKIILNAFGEVLYEKAQKLILLHNDLCDLKMLEGKNSGRIRIGAYESMIVYRLSSILQEYKSKFPNVEIVIQNPKTSQKMISSLNNGEIDIAFFLDEEIKKQELNITKLCEEEVCIIYPNNLSLDSLLHSNRCSFIHTLRGCSYRKIFQDFLDKQNITSKNTIETDSLEVIKQYVLCGVGVSLLPVITVKEEIVSGQLRNIPLKPSNPLYIQIAHHKEKNLSPSMQELLNLTFETTKDW